MNSFEESFHRNNKILMEGALLERLKREFNVEVNDSVALASAVYNEEIRLALKTLFIQYIEIADSYKLPIMITTPTRRANKERVLNSQYSYEIIRDNVKFLKDIKSEFTSEIYIGGLMGCKGDAYKSDEGLTESEALEFHSWQANLFKEAKVEFLYAGIMPTIEECKGMAKAMESTGLPYIISFMIRKNGRLIDNTSISDAIIAIDEATKRNPVCYMTNCVHPNIVHEALSKEFNQTEIVRKRFKGIQANAACLSPEELDNSSQLITSDSISLANSMMTLRDEFDFKIFGGCCGTDNNYINQIGKLLSKY